jgi:hypothetical protein
MTRRQPPLAPIARTALAVAALVLAACNVSSVHPFYFAGDVTGPGEAAGRWSEAAPDGVLLEIGEGAEGATWTYTEHGETHALEAKFFRFQGALFADLRIPEDDLTGDVTAFTVRTHLLLRLRVAGDRLFDSTIDRDVLAAAFKAGELTAAHLVGDDERIVLTGSTAELQGVLGWCLAHGCFREDPEDPGMARLPPTPAGHPEGAAPH